MQEVILPKVCRVVICGAGLIGNSIAYHLVRRGWTDVLVLEKGRIGCGASWRSSHLVGQLCPTVEGITARSSVLLYQQLQETGHDIGWKECGSLYVARSQKRMVSLLRLAAEAKARGVECIVQQPKALKSCHPYIRTEDLVGGVFLPSDGVVNSMALCQTFAMLAEEGGAKYIEQCSVHGVLTDNGSVAAVDTSLGRVQCENLVLAGGMWSRELAQASQPKFAVPIHAAKQSYGITKPVNGIPDTLPVLRDYDGRMYCYKHGDSFLVGGFEETAKPVFTHDVPDKFEFLRLAPDYAQYKPIYAQFQQRCASLQDLELAELVTAPETFTPDAQCILGEASEVEKLFLAVGMNGCQSQFAGGVGRALSRWIVSGAPQAHLLPWDPRRFIELHNNTKFLKERVQEVVGRRCIPPHPLQNEWRTARSLRCSPLLPILEEHGAVTGERMGFERALYFEHGAPILGDRPTPESSYGRPDWLDNVHEEYTACRERVGVSDMSSFSKFYLESGSTEVVDFLQKLCSNDVDVPVGHIVPTGMQNERGGYENDCILVRTHHNRYFMVSPTAQQTRIGRWVQQHLPRDGSVSLRDVTSLYTVLYIMGPKSRSLLEEVTGNDLHRLQPYTCEEMDMAYASNVLVLGYNNTLEPGYSLYVPSEFALHVYNRLMKAGRDYGVMDVGYYTLRFLRIEKFVPFWAEELDSSVTPLEANRSARVKLQKEYFVGKFALQEQAEKGVHRQLAFFQLREHDWQTDPWAWGQEPIFRDGRFVGTTTSGGLAFTLGCNVCQGFVESRNPATGIPEPIPRDYVDGGQFEIELAGRRFPAVASIFPPRLSVAPMGGIRDQYKPQERFSN
uniref:Putative dimethylglycine dehydrogenase n=1 Tax=Ornithodoros turicata TaxID=34597 RepID=A0A2R5LLI5_9ACAR